MKVRFAIALALIIVAASCGRDGEEARGRRSELSWYPSADEAMRDARTEGDLVLLSAGVDWCPWSRLMRESLFVHQSVIESLSSYRCVAFDADRDTVSCRKLGIVLYPTTVITDAYGAELGRMTGYQPPEEFLETLVKIERRSDRLTEMFREEEIRANEPPFLISFGRLLLDIGMYDGALLRFDRASQIDADDEFGTLEEALYSMAECYMLAGRYKEAGRRLRLFAEAYPAGERYEYALVLAGLCYERVNYRKVAGQIYEAYLENPGSGTFTLFVRSRRDSLEARRANGS
jgi:tetratricopeptide (TPR) repeat protein